jgi:fatty-acyl-CoA synthase
MQQAAPTSSGFVSPALSDRQADPTSDATPGAQAGNVARGVGGVASGVTLGQLVREALRGRDARIAFVQDGRSWTYRETSRHIYSLARALQARGLRAGDGLAMLLLNRPETFFVQAAAWVIGARVTALNALAGPQDLRHVLADAEIRLLVHDEALADRARAAAREAGCAGVASLGGSRADDLMVQAAGLPDAPFVVPGSESDIARIAYTGGTTGQPKGVILPHRAMVQQLMMMLAAYQWPQEVRILLSTPLSHAAGSLVLPTLVRGGSVHLLTRFDPDEFVQTVRSQHITTTWLVPTMIGALLQRPQCAPGEMPSLATAIYGAAPIAPARLTEALERIGPVFMQHFGQTEAPNTICLLRKEEHDPVGHPARLASCGRPITGIEVALLDASGNEVADGADGELCVRGRLVMDGYWKRPEETAKTLAHGWLHTGDVARRDADGYVYIVDRIKDMIITGGFNVFPREVEDALATHPAVAACAVVGVPDDVWGEAVKAFVVLREGRETDAQALAAHVRELKGAVQAPKSVDFVAALPSTPVGKVDRKALRQPYWAGRSDGVR